MFVRALAFADDIVLISPAKHSKRLMLNTCDQLPVTLVLFLMPRPSVLLMGQDTFLPVSRISVFPQEVMNITVVGRSY